MIKMKKCPNCKGHGYKKKDNGFIYSCPVCHGQKFIEEKKDDERLLSER